MISFSTSKILVAASVFSIFFSCQLHGQSGSMSDSRFKKADSIAGLYPKHSLGDLKALSIKLTAPLSAEDEKFRAIYIWVCSNIENDFDFYIKNKNKREKLNDNPNGLNQWNQKFAPLVFQKLMNEHKTVCTGYASLIKSLANHAGINCEVINGYGRTAQANIEGAGIANHSWNGVKLNDKWYLCDATWSSGSIDAQQGKFIKQYNDGYFLATPELFVLNHYPLDTTWLLMEQKPELAEFLSRPLIYKSAFNYKIIPKFPKTFKIKATKGETVTFLFTKEAAHDIGKAELQVTAGGHTKVRFPEVCQDTNGLYAINHTFFSKGLFVVHFLIDGANIFSYEVVVSKNEKKAKFYKERVENASFD